MIKLSIITPVYNSKYFIETCILNVVDQKCPYAEHIIVDGGSTAGTIEIIKKYAKQYSHIRWISEKDKGQSDAMNKGIGMAKGEIINFLNADDGYFAFTLNRVVSLFDKNPKLFFISGNCKLLDLNGNLIYINRPQRIKPYHLFSYTEPFPINPVAYFYKKVIHNNIGLYNIENRHNMDYEFILKACLNYNLIYFNEDWGYMLHHDMAITAKDTLSNQLELRKRSVFDTIYKDCSFKIKLLAGLYKFYKLVYRKQNL